jgi:hypothetical protein
MVELVNDRILDFRDGDGEDKCLQDVASCNLARQ